MRIRRSETSGDQFLLNLTPFLDMMFILIVFFLATSSFTEAERDEDIRLAQTRSTMPISTPSKLLVINIDKDGKKIVDGHERTLEEVEEIVRDRRQKDEDADVAVRVDRRGMVAPLLETLEICVRLGFETPNITYANAEE